MIKKIQRFGRACDDLSCITHFRFVIFSPLDFCLGSTIIIVVSLPWYKATILYKERRVNPLHTSKHFLRKKDRPALAV